MKFNPKYRPTHLLLLIFVGLLFYYTISISMTAENKKRSDSILLKFSLADVTGFSILNDRVKQLFTRNRNDWQAQGLPHLKLSKPDIDSFLDDVKNIECIRTIKNTSDLLPFGLNKPTS